MQRFSFLCKRFDVSTRQTVPLRWMFLVSCFVALFWSPSPVLGSEPFPELRGPYLGEVPPGMMPKIFAPGIVSTDRRELNSVFTPDGNEFYFAYSQGSGQYTIMVMRQVDGLWTKPEVASFSREHSNVDLAISHDGQRVYFGSNRPRSGTTPREAGFDLWVALRDGSEWGEPTNLGPKVNSDNHQIYPTVTRGGTLYFQSNREGGFGGSDLYRSPLVAGEYASPENLGAAINTRHDEGDVLIAPDEDWLIVSAQGRDDSLGRGDLYVSFRSTDGMWSEARNMGAPINSSAIDFCPMLSPDGKYLFFSSARNGTPDIFWVDAKVIEAARPTAAR